MGLSGLIDSLFLSAKILVTSQVSESTFVVTIRLERKSKNMPSDRVAYDIIYVPAFASLCQNVWPVLGIKTRGSEVW